MLIGLEDWIKGEKVMKITREIAKKVLDTVDAGLSKGLGKPRPGEMCVEAAVNFALGLPHGDKPLDCVAKSLNNLKIVINDTYFSKERRTKGLRKLAILQLGTATGFDEVEFATRLSGTVGDGEDIS